MLWWSGAFILTHFCINWIWTKSQEQTTVFFFIIFCVSTWMAFRFFDVGVLDSEGWILSSKNRWNQRRQNPTAPPSTLRFCCSLEICRSEVQMLIWMLASWVVGFGPPCSFENVAFLLPVVALIKKKHPEKNCDECIGFGMVKVEREGRFFRSPGASFCHGTVVNFSSHGIFVILRMESFGCEKCPLNHPSIFKVQSSTFELFPKITHFIHRTSLWEILLFQNIPA